MPSSLKGRRERLRGLRFGTTGVRGLDDLSLEKHGAIRPAGDAVEQEVVIGRNLQDYCPRFMGRECYVESEGTWHLDPGLGKRDRRFGNARSDFPE